MVGPIRPQFVLFGSSIVQESFKVGGWGAILADLYDRKADIILRGYSGWNSRHGLQVLHQIFPKEAEIQPSLVIVYFGGNDSVQPHPSGLGCHVPLLEYVENMKQIALYLKSLSEKTRLIFLTAPPVNEAMIRIYFGNLHDNQARTSELCNIYAEALVDLCNELDIKVINLCTVIQRIDDWATSCFSDGIHFSDKGSKIVVKEILKVLKEADWEPSLYWMSMPIEFSDDSPYYMSSKFVPDDPKLIAEPESTGDGGVVNKSSISDLFSSLQLSEIRPIFDVYPPNDKFRKTCPGTPSFVLFLVSGIFHPIKQSRDPEHGVTLQEKSSKILLC